MTQTTLPLPQALLEVPRLGWGRGHRIQRLQGPHPPFIGHAIDDMSHGVTQHKIVYHALRLLIVAAVSPSSSTSPARSSSAPRARSSSTSATTSSPTSSASPPGYYHTHRTGDIMARTTNDLTAVRQLLGPAIMYCANTHRLHRRRAALHDPHQPQADASSPSVPLPSPPSWSSTSAHASIAASSASRPCSPTSPPRRRRTSPAPASSAPSPRRKPRSHPSRRANQEYIGRSLHLVRLMAMLWPTLEFVLGLS